jgi:tRNA nucleotidyltransferase (CCA-adding enzyme)
VTGSFELAELGPLASASPAEIWPELTRGLMSSSPSGMLAAWQASRMLSLVLPEVAALFGVPQITDEHAGVDIGLHTLNALAEAAACEAPLAVRFALLVMNVGKSDSPPEHLPIHYRHIERGAPRIEAICTRFRVPEACRELALLSLLEAERVHRVSEVRAGPVAAMLERLRAFDRPERFGLLMTVCACDYRAYGARSGQSYPKAKLLTLALRACASIEPMTDAPDDGLHRARAAAIAAAFRSERWSS